MTSSLARAGLTFVAACALYGVLFVGCLGTEPGTGASTACGSVGPLLKAPLLYALPHANSRYLGIDSFILFTMLNMLLWGSAVSAIVWFVTGRQRAHSEKT